MRPVIWFVLLFAAAVVAALTLGDNRGLVSFYWNGWRLDLSLNLFLLAAIAIGFVVTAAVHAINGLVGLPQRAREWRSLQRERAAHASLRESLSEFFAGRYSRANKAAQRAIAILAEVETLKDDHEFHVLAHLLSAASLHRLQDRVQRDQQMQQIFDKPPKGAAGSVDDGARLQAAEWALDDRDGARAEQWLSELQPGVARRTQALRLKLKADQMQQRPLEALHTARLLANHQAFTDVAAKALLRALAFDALDAAHDADQLRRVWQQLDAADHLDAYVAARAARRARSLGVAEDGRAWLRPLWERIDTLSADERAQVALALMNCAGGAGTEWLQRVENAQRNWPNDAAVQAAAGAVFVDRQLWGKARRPLELAAANPNLDATARRRTWRALAQLAAEEGDEERAAACHRAAAAID